MSSKPRNEREPFTLFLSENDRAALEEIANAHGLTMNGYLRMLLRREINKLTVELPAKKTKKRTAEYV